MKKILLATAFAALSLGAFATDYVIPTAALDLSKFTRSQYEFDGKQKDQLTGIWKAEDGTVFNVVLKQNTSTANADNIVVDTDQVRWYKNYELTITAPANVGKMTQMTFETTTKTAAFTASGVEATVSGKKVIWTYADGVNPFVAVADKDQIRFNKLTIHTGTPTTPTEPEDPEKPQTTQYDNIAAWLAAADASKASEFKNPVTVVYQNGLNTYVQDASGSMLIYGKIPAYTPGQQIPAGFIGDYKDYYSTIELTLPKDSEANYAAYFATYKAGVAGTAPQPTAVEIAAIDGATMGNKYVKLSGVTIADLNGKNFTIAKGDNSIPGYNKFNIALAATEAGKTVDVIGVVNYYKAQGADAPSAQIYPIEIVGQGAVEPSANTKVANIAAFLAGKDTNATYEFENPVTVVYKNGTNTYVQDATGSMLIYGTTPDYTNGMQIPAGFVGNYVDFYSTIELSIPNTDEAKATYKEGIAGPEVAPTATTVAELLAKGAEWGNKYVKVSGVAISGLDGKNFTIADGETTMPGYLKFNGVTVENTAEGKAVNITGVASWYTNKGAEAPAMQLYPIRVDEAAAISEINADENAPVEYFNLQGVRVNNPEGGLFIMRQGSKVAKVIR